MLIWWIWYRLNASGVVNTYRICRNFKFNFYLPPHKYAFILDLNTYSMGGSECLFKKLLQRLWHPDMNSNLREYCIFLLWKSSSIALILRRHWYNHHTFVFFFLAAKPCCFSCINVTLLLLCPFSVYFFMGLTLLGCLCNLWLQNVDPYCKMTSEELFHLPLNVYIIILGIGLFILMLSLIFCCYLFR